MCEVVDFVYDDVLQTISPKIFIALVRFYCILLLASSRENFLCLKGNKGYTPLLSTQLKFVIILAYLRKFKLSKGALGYRDKKAWHCVYLYSLNINEDILCLVR